MSTIHIEKVAVSDEGNDKNDPKYRILHTVQLTVKAKSEETNENQDNNLNDQKFISKAAFKSLLRVLPENEIFGFEADSLQVTPGELLSTEENDLDKACFKIANNPCHNQLEFDYFLGPWETCLICFKFLSKKIIDISTVEKMNIQDRI